MIILLRLAKCLRHGRNEECQKIEVERHNFYVWEREELLYVDDPVDEDALRKELAAKMADAGEEKII